MNCRSAGMNDSNMGMTNVHVSDIDVSDIGVSNTWTKGQVTGSRAVSVAFDQVSAAGWKLIRVGPEVGDLGNPALVPEFEEAQTGLRTLLPGELDPARGVLALADDPLYRDVPVIGEALHVEPDVGFPAADLLPGLGAAVEHIVGEQCAERIPVPGLRRGPVGRDHLVRAVHMGHATRGGVGGDPGLVAGNRGRERPAATWSMGHRLSSFAVNGPSTTFTWQRAPRSKAHSDALETGTTT